VSRAPRTRSREERQAWRIAFGYLGLIYLSLWPLQFALDFLRSRNLLRLTLATLFLGAAGAVVTLLAKRRAGRLEWLVLALVGALYAALLGRMTILQERLHLLEYGLLALAFARALEARATVNGVATTLGAAGLTALAGWIDELVQGILPNRHYDLRDVGFNALAGALALASTAALRRARSRGASGRAATTPLEEVTRT
jgi:hypothetical protein